MQTDIPYRIVSALLAKIEEKREEAGAMEIDHGAGDRARSSAGRAIWSSGRSPRAGSRSTLFFIDGLTSGGDIADYVLRPL
jgi:hypothetical protein